MTKVILNRGRDAAGSPNQGGWQSCRQRADHPVSLPHAGSLPGSGIAPADPAPKPVIELRESGQCFAAFLTFFPLCLALPASFLVLPLTALASRLAFLPRPITGSFCALPRPALPHTDRVPAELPETRGFDSSTFHAGWNSNLPVSCRQLFSYLWRRPSAGKARDPEGRTRQAAGDRRQRWSPNRRSQPRARWPGRYSRTAVRVRQGRPASRPRTGTGSAALRAFSSALRVRSA
jgi:hypothetical protein